MTLRTIALLGCLLIVGCSRGTKTFSGRIISRTEIPIKSLVNPHVSPVKVLIVDGKRFEKVRGSSPFYMVIPQLNSILFVADPHNRYMAYHIYNMETKEDIKITASSSDMFGETIGDPSPMDSVEVLPDGRIVLTVIDIPGNNTVEEWKNVAKFKWSYYLDLRTRRVLEETSIHYDKAGNILSERHHTPP